MWLACLLFAMAFRYSQPRGNFLVDVRDYAARQHDTHLREPLETTEANLARLVQSLQQKNCMLEPTCTDGNCGLDAIIINLKRLELTEPALVQKVHTVLNKKDLKARARFFGWDFFFGSRTTSTRRFCLT